MDAFPGEEEEEDDLGWADASDSQPIVEDSSNSQSQQVQEPTEPDV